MPDAYIPYVQQWLDSFVEENPDLAGQANQLREFLELVGAW